MGLLGLLANIFAGNKRGGYLATYGLWDWYDSQPKEVQDFLYKSCGYGIGTDPRHLKEGDIEILNAPGEEYPWTATKFLCNHAVTAVSERNHTVCDILLDGAFKSAKSAADSLYYALVVKNIRKDMEHIPDQKQIDIYKPIILQLIKENPGILQSDIKKKFASELENTVGLALWAKVQEGMIKREKKGRSFQLWVVEDI